MMTNSDYTKVDCPVCNIGTMLRIATKDNKDIYQLICYRCGRKTPELHTLVEAMDYMVKEDSYA